MPGRVMVTNDVESHFGSGWRLDGLAELLFNADKSILFVPASGRPINFRKSLIDGSLVAPGSKYSTLVQNKDGTYLHTTKHGIKTNFNAAGRQASHVDRNGNTTTYQYDLDGKLTTITDPVGLMTTFIYDNHALLATVTDPAQRVTRLEHDVSGNLTKITYPDGTFITHGYDENHLMTSRQDERNHLFQYSYDHFGRSINATLPDLTLRNTANRGSAGLIDLSSGEGTQANPAAFLTVSDVQTNFVDGRGNATHQKLDKHSRALESIDAIGRVTRYFRDRESNPVLTIRPNGSQITKTFDGLGNVLTQKEVFNTATTTYTYDLFSLVTSVKNPRNHTTSIKRDPTDGNPLTIVNHLGHTTSMTYDSRGLVKTMTSPNRLVTTYTYNTQGLMSTKTTTPPVGSPGNVRVWTYAYLPTGLLQTVKTPDGITLNYTYDKRSFLKSVTDNLQQSITYTYDNHKNIIKTETHSSDGGLALLVNSIYDSRNRLTETRAPHVGIEASITQRILDANSNLKGLIDANSNPSSNIYDASNRLESNTHREGGISNYEYDLLDRLTKVIAANGVTTEYENDLIGRRRKESSPDRGEISYSYDLANNVISITEGRGIVASMTYDALERLSTKTYPNSIVGKHENVTYRYDSCLFGLGLLCARTDESGSYSYNYDAYGNISNGSFTESQGTRYKMGYLYDDGDHITQMTLPSGRVVDYSRDGLRRIKAIDTTFNGSAQNIISNIQYRGDNQVLSYAYANGLSATRSYDLQGRLQSQQLQDTSNTVIDQRSYSYDKNSNLTNIDTNIEDNAYLYDKRDRLTRDTIDSNSPFDFTYDQNDNRLTKQRQDLSLNEFFEQQEKSNRLSVVAAVKPGLTPIEDLPNRDMVYNDVGRLYQLIEAGTLKAEYLYNDSGQRTRKTVYQGDGISIDSITIYHYDQQGYLITETTETGALIKDYIWQQGLHPVAQIDASMPAQAGMPSEGIIYLHTDHLLTNRLATDATRKVIWRWEGEAFGNTPASGSVSVNLRFPGQYYDAETNLHYNHFRYYDPELGRYITSDPIGLRGGMNTYGYVEQNPIVSIDPRGLDTTYPNPSDNSVYPPTMQCSFTSDCMDNFRENVPPSFLAKLNASGIAQALAEEVVKRLICDAQNTCQCIGTAEGGCPGTPGWVPFPGEGSESQENGEEDGSGYDGSDGDSCEDYPPDDPAYPFPDWSSPRSKCKWDFSQDPPVHICP